MLILSHSCWVTQKSIYWLTDTDMRLYQIHRYKLCSISLAPDMSLIVGHGGDAAWEEAAGWSRVSTRGSRARILLYWAESRAASSREEPLQLQRGEKWLSHLGSQQRTEKREAPAGPQVNTETDSRCYLHTFTRRQHQTGLERELEQKTEEKKKQKMLSGIQTYGSDLMKLGASAKANTSSWRN